MTDFLFNKSLLLSIQMITRGEFKYETKVSRTKNAIRIQYLKNDANDIV